MGKYSVLKDHLASLDGDEWVASFDDIERLLGFALPRSASLHRTWWANSGGTQVHQLAWLDANWRVVDADPHRRIVQFAKASLDDVAHHRRQREVAEQVGVTKAVRKSGYKHSEDTPTVSIRLNWVSIPLNQDIDPSSLPTGPGVVRLCRSKADDQVVIGQVENIALFITDLELDGTDDGEPHCDYLSDDQVTLGINTSARRAKLADSDELDLVEQAALFEARQSGFNVLYL